MEHKTNQSFSLNILLLSLPCNQLPRVQPSAQWGGERDREKGVLAYLDGGGLLPSASDPSWRSKTGEKQEE